MMASCDAFALLWPRFADHHEVHEAFRVLFLDRGNRVKGIFTASSGGLAGTVVDPRLIISAAARTLSAGIILAHNHPAGQEHPSEEDLQLTRTLAAGARLFDIQVRDHIIICGPSSYYSFRDHNRL